MSYVEESTFGRLWMASPNSACNSSTACLTLPVMNELASIWRLRKAAPRAERSAIGMKLTWSSQGCPSS